MSDTDYPSVLRGAAQRLRDLAAKAEPGPWQACQPWTTGGEFPTEVRTVTTTGYPNRDIVGYSIWTEDDGQQGGIDPGTALWIAALNPAIAEPLAAWLDDTAEDFEIDRRSEPVTSHEDYAVTFARAILDGAP